MNTLQFSSWCQTPHDKRSTLLMGILNVTPDSFSDGGSYTNATIAYDRALEMIEQGADIIDIGGESTRPGATAVSVQEELDRVMPVIQRLCASHDVCISIDTYKPEVMREAIGAGAALVNDVRALRVDDALAVVAKTKAHICLMHMQGFPGDMQKKIHYDMPVIDSVNVFFDERISACVQAGISRDRLILDPGFGYGKTVQHNLELIKQLSAFQPYQIPILIGVSRKSTIGAILNKNTSERLLGGLALTSYAVIQGAAIIRAHDVTETKQVLMMLDAIKGVKNYND